MFAEVVHGLLTNVLRASGFDQPTVDAILPQPKWRIGIIPAGMLISSVTFCGQMSTWIVLFIDVKCTFSNNEYLILY